jgi:tRNA (cytidine/uridine-2'-O-)-methyltransferase
MFNIVLFQPEIPPNTGNIMRLAGISGCNLHLIGPLGFDLQEKNLRRAHLDYRDYTDIQVYEEWNGFLAQSGPKRLWAFSTKGSRLYSDVVFEQDDYFLFGPESRGLPEELLQGPGITGLLTLPMLPDRRSLNLSNAVAVVIYEAWRQQGFAGASLSE